MLIEGAFTVHASPQEVWDFLSDIPRMSVCIPGMQRVAQTDETAYTGAVSVHMGGIKSSFQGTVTKTVIQAPERLVTTLHAWDAKTASILTGEAAAQLTRLDDETTQVAYRLDLTLRGRLNQFEQATLKAGGEELLEAFVACARARIERPAASLPIVPDSAWQILQRIFAALGRHIRSL